MTSSPAAQDASALRVFAGDEALAHERVADVLARSRGRAYGDGVFETMRAHRGAIHWWPAHWARAARGAERLGFALPSRARVEAEWETTRASMPALENSQIERVRACFSAPPYRDLDDAAAQTLLAGFFV